MGPLMGGYFILRSGQVHSEDLESVKHLYQAIGAAILAVAIAFSFVKVPPLKDIHASEPSSVDLVGTPAVKKLRHQRHFVWAVAAQFFNVAAQGGTWAFFINYGVEKMGLPAEKAAYYFAFSMVLMMAGRFVGTFLMRFFAPNRLLAAFTLANALLCLIVAQSLGWPSFVALMMLNFFLSIMYPTIFSLGLKGLGRHTQQASSFIVMGVVGGAFFPPIMGLVANHDVASAYYLPILCYAVIFLYATKFCQRSVS